MLTRELLERAAMGRKFNPNHDELGRFSEGPGGPVDSPSEYGPPPAKPTGDPYPESGAEWEKISKPNYGILQRDPKQEEKTREAVSTSSRNPIYEQSGELTTEGKALEFSVRALSRGKVGIDDVVGAYSPGLPEGWAADVQVTQNSSDTPTTLSVRVKILSPEGGLVGGISRRVDLDGGSVEHQSFMLNKKYQGLGLGGLFSVSADHFYRKAGISKINTYAISDTEDKITGHQMWPMQGFDWDPPGSSAAHEIRTSFQEAIVKRYGETSPEAVKVRGLTRAWDYVRFTDAMGEKVGAELMNLTKLPGNHPGGANMRRDLNDPEFQKAWNSYEAHVSEKWSKKKKGVKFEDADTSEQDLFEQIDRLNARLGPLVLKGAKFNPNHDPTSGEFATGPVAGGGEEEDDAAKRDMGPAYAAPTKENPLGIYRGVVIKNIKSENLYVVTDSRPEGDYPLQGGDPGQTWHSPGTFGYIGVRNGTRFGPFRGGILKTAAKTFTKTTMMATFSSPTGFTFTVPEEAKAAKFNPNHDEQGRFSETDGEAGPKIPPPPKTSAGVYRTLLNTNPQNGGRMIGEWTHKSGLEYGALYTKSGGFLVGLKGSKSGVTWAAGATGHLSIHAHPGAGGGPFSPTDLPGFAMLGTQANHVYSYEGDKPVRYELEFNGKAPDRASATSKGSRLGVEAKATFGKWQETHKDAPDSEAEVVWREAREEAWKTLAAKEGWIFKKVAL